MERRIKIAVARSFRAWMDSVSARYEPRAMLYGAYRDRLGWALR